MVQKTKEELLGYDKDAYEAFMGTQPGLLQKLLEAITTHEADQIESSYDKVIEFFQDVVNYNKYSLEVRNEYINRYKQAVQQLKGQNTELSANLAAETSSKNEKIAEIDAIQRELQETKLALQTSLTSLEEETKLKEVCLAEHGAQTSKTQANVAKLSAAASRVKQLASDYNAQTDLSDLEGLSTSRTGNGGSRRRQRRRQRRTRR